MSLGRAVLLGLAILAGCATAPFSPSRYQALSPKGRTLFDKYHQFMDDDQTEAFFDAKSDAERANLVAGLHIQARLAHYPAFIRKAIWSRTVVVGMDKPALFLSLGMPDSVDRENVDPDTKQLPREVWHYRRGPNQEIRVTIVNDRVIDVQMPTSQ